MQVKIYIICFLIAFGIISNSALSSANFSLSVSFVEPPPLPVYVQPLPPVGNYVWAPGYWAYDSFFEDYYWVPGTWVLAPRVGYYWTPGYWYWNQDRFIFSEGYWGPHIGFYGGINYGYGYSGSGYYGGSWRRGAFVHNTYNVTKVTNVTNNITNNNIVNNSTTNNIQNNVTTPSFNGGPRGTNVKPTPVEQVAIKENHIQPTIAQIQHVKAAGNNRNLFASVNRGKPVVAATVKAGVFKGKGVIPAKQAGASYEPKTKKAIPVNLVLARRAAKQTGNSNVKNKNVVINKLNQESNGNKGLVMTRQQYLNRQKMLLKKKSQNKPLLSDENLDALDKRYKN